MSKIGIPRALYSYYHFPVWQKFFELLDCEIILSPPTTKNILSDGLKIATEEICLPVKTFLGHCAHLKNKCDYLLVPRIVCMFDDAQNLKYGCPKAMGLPDIVRACFNDSIHIIDFTIDERKIDKRNSYYKIGQIFTTDIKKIRRAYDNAITSKFSTSFAIRQWGNDAIPQPQKFCAVENRPFKSAIGLIGHPYLIYDAYISLSLIDLIERFNIKVITPSDIILQQTDQSINTSQKNSLLPNLSLEDNLENKSQLTQINCLSQHRRNKKNSISRLIDDIHWFYEQDIIMSTEYLLKTHQISGFIFAFSLSCGTSAVILEIIKKELLDCYRIPTLFLPFDEHTTSVGLTTRLESFIDLVQRAEFHTYTQIDNNFAQYSKEKILLH
ncbi:MAG: acyl-CoA dehydratase activase-related protein [candidate division WOR-3 bacterium]